MTKHSQPESEKRSISGPSELFASADERMKARMMSNFSEYVRDLIRRDCNGKLVHVEPAKEAA